MLQAPELEARRAENERKLHGLLSVLTNDPSINGQSIAATNRQIHGLRDLIIEDDNALDLLRSASSQTGLGHDSNPTSQQGHFVVHELHQNLTADPPKLDTNSANDVNATKNPAINALAAGVAASHADVVQHLDTILNAIEASRQQMDALAKACTAGFQETHAAVTSLKGSISRPASHDVSSRAAAKVGSNPTNPALPSTLPPPIAKVVTNADKNAASQAIVSPKASNAAASSPSASARTASSKRPATTNVPRQSLPDLTDNATAGRAPTSKRRRTNIPKPAT